MAQKNITEQFDTLPPEAQRQVLDFIAFLRTRYQPAAQKGTKPDEILVDEKFVGMWRNRVDLQDSGAWVRETRAKEWGNGS